MYNDQLRIGGARRYVQNAVVLRQAATLDAVGQSQSLWPAAIGLSDADAESDRALFADLAVIGIEYEQVVAELEEAGVASFIAAWNTLLRLVEAAQSAGGN